MQHHTCKLIQVEVLRMTDKETKETSGKINPKEDYILKRMIEKESGIYESKLVKPKE